MEVLVLLAARAGEVVSREELLAAVWAGSVVGDDALTQAVIKLRRALGDDARTPAYIETIAKRGYRLVAPVRWAPEPPAPPEVPLTRHRRRPLRLVGLALAALVAAAAGLYFARPERAAPGPELPPPPAVDVAALAGLPTVTVRPFEALGEAAPDYLARGIAADLATDLARLGALRVISASQGPGVRGAARYVVSGSVQRGPERIRINVWLVEAGTGRQLWSERYERPLRDLFALQAEIVERLVQALPLQLSEAERRRAAARHTRNLEAYDLFLRAYAARITRQFEDNLQARALYRQAIALDPTFARAYAGLAMSYADEHRYQWSGDGEGALSQAMALARTAMQIDAGVREVHYALAYVHMQRRLPAEAIRHLKRAVELDPSYADAYAYLGAVYVYSGQPAKALPLLRYGMRLNPDAGYLYYMSLGEAYFFLGETEQALLNLNEALARNPASLETRLFLAAAQAAAGQTEAARWEAEEIRMLAPGFSLPDWLETSPLTDARQKRRVVELLRGYGL